MSRAESRSLLVTLAIALLSLVVSGFVAYSHETDSTHSRTTAVEVQQANDGKRLDRIEIKIDHLIESLLGEHPTQPK